MSLFTEWLPLIALGIDLFVGDPLRLPHPVQAQGWLADRLESALRRAAVSRGSVAVRMAGAGGVVVLSGLSYILVDLLCSLPVVGFGFALYFAVTGLALGCLLREGRRAAACLRKASSGDLGKAQQAVQRLVSRDASQLDRQGCFRALAESLSENLNDGFVAPFFFLILGGPAGLWAYKAVSTLDSMWGYRTERWRDFGWAAARLDDILAFLPARICALSMLAVMPLLRLLGGNGYEGWRVFGLFGPIARDSRRTDSPNAGWPMAAAAWLIGKTLGGPAVYFGQLKDKPCLGPLADDGSLLPWDEGSLDFLRRLVLWAGVFSGLFLFWLEWLFRM